MLDKSDLLKWIAHSMHVTGMSDWVSDWVVLCVPVVL